MAPLGEVYRRLENWHQPPPPLPETRNGGSTSGRVLQGQTRPKDTTHLSPPWVQLPKPSTKY